MLINNCIKRGPKSKYFPLIFLVSSWLRTYTPTQYENILTEIKNQYMNLYAILAWCWRLELRVWFNLLGLKLLQCLDSVFFWILRSHCSIFPKVKIFILVWVSWSHSCCFYSFRSTNKYLWKNLKNRSYRWIKAWENVQFVTKAYVQWCIKLTDGGWKTLTNLAETWNSVVLAIDHQYCEYTQVHELIVDRKTAFCKKHRSRNCCLAY